MRFVAGAVIAVAAIEAAALLFVPVAQLGILGENPDGDPFLEPLTTMTYWLTAVPCLAAVTILASCLSTVATYPRSSQAAILRTGSLIGFSLINVAYFLFAVLEGTLHDNPAMFGYSLLGLTAAASAGALLRVRPRRLVS